MGRIDEEERGCTDIFCCIIFFLFVVAMIGVSGYGFGQGDPTRLITAFDSDGNLCGQPGQDKSVINYPGQQRDFSDYKLKYFSNLQSIVTSNSLAEAVSGTEPAYVHSVCVKTCPTKDKVVECVPNDDVRSCPSGLTGIPFNTKNIMGYCVPEWSEVKDLGTALIQKFDEMSGGAMTRYVYDLYESWPVLLAMAFVSLLITIMYLYILQCCIGPILYTSIFLVFICGIGLTGFSFMKWSSFPDGSQDKDTALALGITAGVITLVYTVCICCMWTSISIGIDVLKVTARFIRTNKCLTLGPLITYLMLIPVILWWVAACLYLYSIGEVKYFKSDMFPRIEQSTSMANLFYFFFIGILWIILFLAAVMQFTTIVAAVNWYFSGQGSDIEEVRDEYSQWEGLRWSFRYHFGTLAFGSFLIFVITVIKFIFEYFAKKAESFENGPQGAAVKVFLCCIRCCIWCVDCCIKFITENAYIQTAIRGTAFCTSAKESFYMMVRNPGTFAATSTVGFLVTLIGKGFITALIAWLTYILTGYALPSVEQPIVPGVFGALMGFTTASLFLQMFDFTALSILQCFLVNKESGGTIAAPEELREHLDRWEEEEAKYQEAKRQEMIANNKENES